VAALEIGLGSEAMAVINQPTSRVVLSFRPADRAIGLDLLISKRLDSGNISQSSVEPSAPHEQ
jgi:hypothetical protein